MRYNFDHLVLNSPRIVILLFVIFLVPGFLFAQKEDKVKAELFREVDAAFEQARNKEVPVLAPKLFPKALRLYRRAETEYDNGERIKKIRERIDEALEAINKAIEAAKVSRVALSDLFTTRKQATAKREYIDLVPKEFAKAERYYQQAITKAEDGDIKSAQKTAKEAIQLYREMTIKALLAGPIKTAEAQLKKARSRMSKDEHKKAKRDLEDLKKSVSAAKKQEFGIPEYDAKTLARIDQIVATDISSSDSQKRPEAPAPAATSSRATAKPKVVSANQPAITSKNPITEKLALMGSRSGMLGSMTTQALSTSDGIGHYQNFQNGSIYWTSQTGAHAVFGEIRNKWLSIGAEKSVLGYPIADEELTPAGEKIVRFQHGMIRWTQERGVRVELKVVTLPRRVMLR